MNESECPFCHLENSSICLENEVAVAFPDAFPIAEGHTLVVPKQHVASLFDLSENEQEAVWRLVAIVRAKLIAEVKPDGINFGINDGTAAGQTLIHFSWKNPVLQIEFIINDTEGESDDGYNVAQQANP